MRVDNIAAGWAIDMIFLALFAGLGYNAVSNCPLS